jgi:hypothetical protein
MGSFSVSIWVDHFAVDLSKESPFGRPPFWHLAYSENSPGAVTNGPTLVTIAEKNAHKGVGSPKRRHAVTALQALDLRVTPE